MTISLEKIGKRFNYDWIFRGLDFRFEKANSYAILGPNGSGKSTLLQILAGSLHASEGSLSYLSDDHTPLPAEGLFRSLSMTAPYLELVEEFSLRELLRFHGQFKPFIGGVTPESMAHAVGLEKALDKPIRLYSSGMKQRAKLAQAIFSDTPLLLLDEPCTNLDAAGIALYRDLVDRYAAERLLIVSSNDPQEYAPCRVRLELSEFKKA